jgi:methylated-DNA-protein-cysteine methyltransferase-like protein
VKRRDMELERALRRSARRADPARDESILEVIRRIPRGRVAAYSAVAAAAGYPLHHRLVVQLLRRHGDRLPWHRVLGAGGEIRLRAEAALEQSLRLEAEGVRFRGKRVAPEHILTAEELVCLRL